MQFQALLAHEKMSALKTCYFFLSKTLAPFVSSFYTTLACQPAKIVYRCEDCAEQILHYIKFCTTISHFVRSQNNRNVFKNMSSYITKWLESISKETKLAHNTHNILMQSPIKRRRRKDGSFSGTRAKGLKSREQYIGTDIFFFFFNLQSLTDAIKVNLICPFLHRTIRALHLEELNNQRWTSCHDFSRNLRQWTVFDTHNLQTGTQGQFKR